MRVRSGYVSSRKSSADESAKLGTAKDMGEWFLRVRRQAGKPLVDVGMPLDGMLLFPQSESRVASSQDQALVVTKDVSAFVMIHV